jgi:hypothetical protein
VKWIGCSSSEGYSTNPFSEKGGTRNHECAEEMLELFRTAPVRAASFGAIALVRYSVMERKRRAALARPQDSPEARASFVAPVFAESEFRFFTTVRRS